jgi:thiamine biosynthesis lipoprotein
MSTPSTFEASPTETPVAVRTFGAIGTTAVVAVTDPTQADRAEQLVADELRALDETCSRFRPDSELRRIEQESDGRPVAISALLYELLEVACAVAVETAGIVDPTIGSALVELGYDRDFELVSAIETAPDLLPCPAPGWWRIQLDPDERSVTIPAGVHVDLGSVAKAFAADRAASHLAVTLGCGALVNLGGDVAVSGPVPPGGWAVGIADTCTTGLNGVVQTVAITDGGLATSGTTARSWTRGGRTVHHIIDPWTGDAAPVVWSLVTVAGSTCVEANGWSTAAVVWGEDAVGNLVAQGVDARLVRPDGSVVLVGGWPHDDALATAAPAADPAHLLPTGTPDPTLRKAS